MNIHDFLNKHMIVKIGAAPLEYVCSELIVDNPEELIDVVLETGCFISSIRWWERTHLLSTPNLGYGGPLDPRCPSSYFFAETDLEQEFDEGTLKNRYIEYLQFVKSRYPQYNLYPAFDIKKKR